MAAHQRFFRTRETHGAALAAAGYRFAHRSVLPSVRCRAIVEYSAQRCNGKRNGWEGRSRKVHAVVDGNGRPRCRIITAGQVHDSKVMPGLLDDAGDSFAVVADKAYGSSLIRQHIADQGALAVIPSKSNALKPIPHDKGLYRMRTIVERFFCAMKDMRRSTTRYGKLSANFLAMVHIFAIRLWIN